MFRKRTPPVGSRPGTFAIPEGAPPPVIRIMDYTLDAVEERDVVEVADLPPYLSKSSVTWIDVRGLGGEATLRALAALIGMHPLAIADVVNVPQRPKAEEYDTHEFVVVRMPVDPHDDTFTEQVSLVIGNGFVVTFQEREGDVFDPVRQRIRLGRGPIRRSGADYLAYALIDMVIDAYFPLMERVGDLVEALEEDVITQDTRRTLRRIYALKRLVQELRRTVWPHREALSTLLREDSELVSPPVRIYLRDTLDHVLQLIDALDGYREAATGLIDVYLSSESNRTNAVMRVLTVTASIFIPLTFIAGVYGMNFNDMPELHSRVGYPLVLTAMAAVAVSMLWYFHRRGWLGDEEHSPADPPVGDAELLREPDEE